MEQELSEGTARAGRQAVASDEEESIEEPPEARQRGYRQIDTGSRHPAESWSARWLSGRVRWLGEA